MQSKLNVKAPYGLQIIESCLECPLAKHRNFCCDLPQNVLAGLDEISSVSTYPPNAILFAEGQKSRGVFIICNGRVKLSASSEYGKSITVCVAEAGMIVGLPSTISGKPYEVTAEVLDPLQANFVPREAYLQFVRQHSEVALLVTETLNQIYYSTLAEVRCLGLSWNSAEKLARFLLELPTLPSGSNARSTLTLTHNEIAEVIGASRETVTRLFTKFKKEGYIEIHGSTVVFVNKHALQDLRHGEPQITLAAVPVQGRAGENIRIRSPNSI